nr:immunoglobulin heavy chain junction region [Macaca mulatta]MOW76602.1 immunoglobulin heavy chain junction region [Macaca mulatta]MOW78914.1 immunoglobulin heavy chain junction region [Macaca mulatta]MOW79070.1 immunoglobulin heavy chain junction region [Macaca mulatta]MOW80746.1 immunoglobulin heavy chain junction region [Macaca mulatta]
CARGSPHYEDDYGYFPYFDFW